MGRLLERESTPGIPAYNAVLMKKPAMFNI
jgi:hypothetical protein